MELVLLKISERGTRGHFLPYDAINGTNGSRQIVEWMSCAMMCLWLVSKEFTYNLEVFGFGSVLMMSPSSFLVNNSRNCMVLL